MKVSIEFFTIIEEITKKQHHEVIFDSEPHLLGELINKLVEEFGLELKTAIFERHTKGLRPGIAVAVNGRPSTFLQGMETLLKNGDKVSLGAIDER